MPVTTQLYCGDALEVMATMDAGSIDAIITDLPYGTTACKWDEVIPFAPMWAAVKRLLKPRGVFVTTASQPFTSALVMSNLEWFKYAMVWDKGFGTDWQLSNIKPLKAHEDIAIFGGAAIAYNPQKMKLREPRDRTNESGKQVWNSQHNNFHSKEWTGNKIYTNKFPLSVLQFNSQADECNNTSKLHPTQKPVALYAYLIRTYTNPGDTVLDPTMGSGTTGVAAIKEGRNFVGCDNDANYFAIAKRRIEQAAMQMSLELEVA